MSFEPWILVDIDQAGYNGIREEHIDAVAEELLDIGQTEIDADTFNAACRRRGIDPNNFTQRVLDELGNICR